jgi:hypothetical protein
LLSLIPGGVGFVLFVYCRKQQRWPMLVAGLLFMIYPYFTTHVTALVAVGAGLSLGLHLVLRAGH